MPMLQIPSLRKALTRIAGGAAAMVVTVNTKTFHIFVAPPYFKSLLKVDVENCIPRCKFCAPFSYRCARILILESTPNKYGNKCTSSSVSGTSFVIAKHACRRF